MAMPWLSFPGFGFPGLGKAANADTVKYDRRRSDRPDPRTGQKTV
jgi:hypothetical protein